MCVRENDPIADLIAEVAEANRDAFRMLYSSASGKLLGVTFRILQDRSEAEDAVQEVFTRVWLNARRFDAAKARGMTWLIAIARNHAIDRLRARPAPADGDEAMAGLREAIRGAYLNGQSYEELSVRHDVPLNTMRSWLRRGLLKLKECLEA